jgi:hypothetical protein
MVILFSIFGAETVRKEILEEYRHPEIISTTGQPLQLDLYYPQLSIAFEYQVNKRKIGGNALRDRSIMELLCFTIM